MQITEGSRRGTWAALAAEKWRLIHAHVQVAGQVRRVSPLGTSLLAAS